MNSLRSLTNVGMKVLTVGVSGATGAGKTSIAHLLKSAFPQAKLICQDDYYFTDVDSLPKAPDGTNRANWDSLESLDMVNTERVNYREGLEIKSTYFLKGCHGSLFMSIFFIF